MISEKIKLFRKLNKLTQAELAEKANVSLSAIKQYELGLRQPRLEQLEKIALALNIDLSRLSSNSSDNSNIKRGYLNLHLYDSNPILTCKIKDKIEETDASNDLYFNSISDAQLKEWTFECFNNLNKRGKIEAYIRMFELANNSRFNSLREKE